MDIQCWYICCGIYVMVLLSTCLYRYRIMLKQFVKMFSEIKIGHTILDIQCWYICCGIYVIVLLSTCLYRYRLMLKQFVKMFSEIKIGHTILDIHYTVLIYMPGKICQAVIVKMSVKIQTYAQTVCNIFS